MHVNRAFINDPNYFCLNKAISTDCFTNFVARSHKKQFQFSWIYFLLLFTWKTWKKRTKWKSQCVTMINILLITYILEIELNYQKVLRKRKPFKSISLKWSVSLNRLSLFSNEMHFSNHYYKCIFHTHNTLKKKNQ